MMPVDVSVFVNDFGARFETLPAGVALAWSTDDADFGKLISWDVRAFAPELGQTAQVNASVDLQLTQATLSVSVRDMEEGALANTDTELVFVGLVQFEDKTISVNGEPREFTEASLADMIREFNEATRQ